MVEERVGRLAADETMGRQRPRREDADGPSGSTQESPLARRGDPILLRIARVFGPLNRPMAGRRWFPLYAVVHARGRRTGRAYAIPVALRVNADGFFIGLPFGERTQWVRNVLAAGGCTLRWRGEDLPMTDPQIVGAEAAAPAFNALQRWILRTGGVHQFIRLRPAEDPLGRGHRAASPR